MRGIHTYIHMYVYMYMCIYIYIHIRSHFGHWHTACKAVGSGAPWMWRTWESLMFQASCDKFAQLICDVVRRASPSTHLNWQSVPRITIIFEWACPETHHSLIIIAVRSFSLLWLSFGLWFCFGLLGLLVERRPCLRHFHLVVLRRVIAVHFCLCCY